MQQMLILSLTKLIGDFEQVLFSIPEDGRILELDLTRATFRAITVRVGFWLWISVCLTLLFSCFPRLMILNSWRIFWVRRAYPCWSRVVYYTKGSKTEMQTEPQHWSLCVLNHIHLRFWGYRLEQFWCTVQLQSTIGFFPPDTVSEMYFYVQKVGAGWLGFSMFCLRQQKKVHVVVFG